MPGSRMTTPISSRSKDTHNTQAIKGNKLASIAAQIIGREDESETLPDHAATITP